MLMKGASFAFSTVKGLVAVEMNHPPVEAGFLRK